MGYWNFTKIPIKPAELSTNKLWKSQKQVVYVLARSVQSPHIVQGNCKCHLNTLKNPNRNQHCRLWCWIHCPQNLRVYLTTIQRDTDVCTNLLVISMACKSADLGVLACSVYYILSLGTKNCPDIIWKVICSSGSDAAYSSDEDDATVSECFLLLMQNVMHEFDSAIRMLENESATLLDGVISRLHKQLISCCADRFYGSKKGKHSENFRKCTEFATLADSFFKKWSNGMVYTHATGQQISSAHWHR